MDEEEEKELLDDGFHLLDDDLDLDDGPIIIEDEEEDPDSRFT
jgi:hypothetical protein